MITRRAKFELAKARDRAHLLLGLVIAVTNLDEVVRIIRGSASPAEARAALLAREWPIAEIAPYIALVEAVEHEVEGDTYRLSEAQVRAILELRLHRLTALGRDEIAGELRELATSIGELLDILGDRVKLYAVMREEFDEIADAYATPRVTEIAPAWDGIEDEDLIEREDMVVTVTLGGYIKRTPLETFRAQSRGGKGRAGMATKDEDAVTNLFVTSTHTPVLFFSTHGKVYRLKVWRLPEGAPQARGRPMVNLLPLAEGETISTVLPLPEDEAEWGKLHVMFATAQGARPAQLDGCLRQHPHRAARSRCASTRGSCDGPADRRRPCSPRRTTSCSPPATARRSASRRPRARVPEPHLDRRARHHPDRRRRGDLAVDPARLRGDDRGARGLSARRAVEGRRARADARRPSAWPSSPRPRSSSSPSAPTAMASAARPMNIAAPTAAARASPISTISRPQRPGRRELPRA